MKGFFDSIPHELDESAKVDGRRRPRSSGSSSCRWAHRARGDRPALVHRDAERVRPREHPAPVAGQVHALGRAVHLVSREYGEQWGPFCAGVVLMAVPVVILFLFLQRFIVQGRTGGVLDEPGRPAPRRPELYVVERPTELGGEATVRLRVPRGTTADEVGSATCATGATGRACRDRRGDRDGYWWRATSVWNPVTLYRWVLAGGDVGYGGERHRAGRPRHAGRRRLRALARPRRAEWRLRSVVYQIFPDRFATSGQHRLTPGVGGGALLGRVADGPASGHAAGALRRRPRGHRGPARPHRAARRQCDHRPRSSRRRAPTGTTRRPSTTSTRCSEATGRWPR